jgi:DNA-3-methyladenine glycosylase I
MNQIFNQTEMPTYCEFIDRLTGEARALNLDYHDNHYGFPLFDDNELFGRFLLEINQAGLSWTLMLKKLENFRRAYDGFDTAVVAGYGESDFARLMNDKGIIRNRLKIRAAIENARRIEAIKASHGSFRKWLDTMTLTHNTLGDWTKLFKREFVFTGGEIVNEFLMSISMLPGAHSADCPVWKRIKQTYGLKDQA